MMHINTTIGWEMWCDYYFHVMPSNISHFEDRKRFNSVQSFLKNKMVLNQWKYAVFHFKNLNNVVVQWIV